MSLFQHTASTRDKREVHTNTFTSRCNHKLSHNLWASPIQLNRLHLADVIADRARLERSFLPHCSEKHSGCGMSTPLPTAFSEERRAVQSGRMAPAHRLSSVTCCSCRSNLHTDTLQPQWVTLPLPYLIPARSIADTGLPPECYGQLSIAEPTLATIMLASYTGL